MTDNENLKDLKKQNSEIISKCNLFAKQGDKLLAEIERLQKELKKQIDEKHKFKAEIERLKKENNLFADLGKMYSEIKAEAVKEFAEKVQTEIKKALESNYKARAEKEKEEFNKYLDNLLWNYCTGKIDCLRGIDDFIDNLLKETVGDADDK